MTDYTATREFCTAPLHRGRRWLHACEFNRRYGRRRKLDYHCKTCKRRYRARPEIAARARALGIERRLRCRPREGPLRVEAEPFRAWLTEQVQALGIANVAAAAGASQRLVFTYCAGVYTKSYTLSSGERVTRRYAVKRVEAATVHEFMRALGEYPEDLYPELR